MGWFMEVSLRSPKTPKALGPERISCQKPTIAWWKTMIFRCLGRRRKAEVLAKFFDVSKNLGSISHPILPNEQFIPSVLRSTQRAKNAWERYCKAEARMAKLSKNWWFWSHGLPIECLHLPIPNRDGSSQVQSALPKNLPRRSRPERRTGRFIDRWNSMIMTAMTMIINYWSFITIYYHIRIIWWLFGDYGDSLSYIEWLAPGCRRPPFWGVGLKVVGLYLTQPRPRFCTVVRVRANKKPLMCGLGVPVGCRMKHAKGMFKRCGLGAALLPARFGVPRSFCTVCRVLRVLRVSV